MTTSRLWLRRLQRSSPSAFRRPAVNAAAPALAPRAGKTPPSAGPKLSCWREACPDRAGGCDSILARSLASGYSFIGAMEGAGVLPVLTGKRRAIPSLSPDPVAQIEPAISSQTSESEGRGRPYRVVRIGKSMSASGHPASGLSGVRRRIPRYPVAIPVDITVLRSGAPASIPGRSLDIGEGGVAAVLAAELQPGEWVAVELQLPNAGHSLQTKAVVRHHNQLRCGFEFLGLSGDQKLMIRQLGRHSPASAPRTPGSRTPVSASPSTRMTAAPVPLQPWACRHAAQPALTPARNLAVERLLRLTLALLVRGRGLGGVAMASRLAATGSTHGEKRCARATALGQGPGGGDGAIAGPPGRAGVSRSGSPGQSSGRGRARRDHCSRWHAWSTFVRSAAPTPWFRQPWTQPAGGASVPIASRANPRRLRLRCQSSSGCRRRSMGKDTIFSCAGRLRSARPYSLSMD